MSLSAFLPLLGPLLEQKKEVRRLKGEIAKALLFYAPICAKSWSHDSTSIEPEREEAADTFKTLAADLVRFQNSTPSPKFYGLWERVRLLPRRSDLATASAALRRISVDLFNEVSSAVDQIKESRREIRKALDLDLGQLNDR